MQRLFNFKRERRHAKRQRDREPGHFNVYPLRPLQYPHSCNAGFPEHDKRKVYHKVKNPEPERPPLRPIPFYFFPPE